MQLMTRYRAAVAAYPIDWLSDWQAYERKLTDWVSDATRQGASLLVFPEYAAMELASLAGKAVAADLQQQIDVLSERAVQIDALHQDLAQRFNCYVLAGSLPLRLSPTRVVNRARLFGPEGCLGYQDKQIMTRFERELWRVESGDGLRVFDTPLGRLGILICYDSEFPLLGRQLAEAGVEVLLVPSCTDTLAGYWRVRIGAMARALENQCYVLQAPTVGEADWSPAVDENVGAAAIYGPPDRGFPETGVLAEGELNQPGWVIAEIDLEAVAQVREAGQVLNFKHWPEQFKKDER